MGKVTGLYLNIISVNLIALGFFLFPLLFLPFFSDAFVLPKQAILLVVVFVGLLLWGISTLVERKVTIRSTPLTLPLTVFLVVMVVSALIPFIQSGGNFKTPLIALFPLLTLVFLYFLTVNAVHKGRQVEVALWGLLGGAVLAGSFTILNFLHIFILPLDAVKTPTFNTFGNLLQILFFFIALIPVTVLTVIKNLRKTTPQIIGYLMAASVITIASVLIIYQLISLQASGQKITLLPQTTGLQVATGAIGQNFKTLLFGTGPGTFLSDFTRFKGPEFNQSDFWNLRFFTSSSLVLEILATMGLLGLLSYLFIVYRLLKTFSISKTKDALVIGLFLGSAILLVLSVLLPFIFTTIALLFILLSLYSIASETAEETTFIIVALPKSAPQNLLPGTVFGILLLLSGFSLYFGGAFLVSDARFQDSLVAASQNRGTETYNLQRETIAIFPYRDGYYRTFSQTNLALANALALKGKDLTDQDRQTIIGLVQQSITNARVAVTMDPQNPFNWENLGSIYRSLIGFGDGADTFAIASAQQVIRLDPANPQIYLFLGGIYYQLKQWDNAIIQFQTSANLKPDFANAYYNLGHSLEEKNDLKGALAQYRIVQGLVATTVADKQKIDEEIAALAKKIGELEAAAKTAETKKAGLGEQPPLTIEKPAATFPPQKPPVAIPQPPAEAR